MTLMQLLTLLAAVAAGALIAGLYFGALWITVAGLGRTRRPTLTLLVSLLVRLALACGAFYIVTRLGSWTHLLAASTGFLLLRLAMVRRVTPVTSRTSLPPGEHAEADG